MYRNLNARNTWTIMLNQAADLSDRLFTSLVKDEFDLRPLG
jgi:hypothetical protein